MHITIERESLNSALASVKRVVEKRHIISVLSDVLLNVSGNRLTIKGTDCDMELSFELTGEGLQDGTMTLSAHMLADIVKAAPKGSRIALQSIESNCGNEEDYESPRAQVISGLSKATLTGIQSADFPKIEESAWTHKFEINAQEFKRLMNETAFAISTEKTRYYLNGIYFHANKDTDEPPTLRAVATDGHKLARAEIPLPDGAAGMPGVIVPRKAVVEMIKLIGKDKGALQAALNENLVEFRISGAVFLTKTIDGAFPDYRRIIPRDYDKTSTLDRLALIAAVKRVGAMSSERGKTVKLAFDQDRLTFIVNNPKHGSTKDSIDSENRDAELNGFEIGFNARYLVEIAETVTGDRLQMKMNGPGDPTTICGETGESVFVIMPMRV